nr:Chain B, Voltage-dependent L-type calcium channel subunit alpha-1S [Oryctolagus cuniculus]
EERIFRRTGGLFGQVD